MSMSMSMLCCNDYMSNTQNLSAFNKYAPKNYFWNDYFQSSIQPAFESVLSFLKRLQPVQKVELSSVGPL